ncbi:helix-turn-helix domain-containing protein [Salinactinospora qingdaonensis]|uniref:Helix-turn-helix domain-containing protein n=1 Tax=Salinactinospora qingdaonensis TaxID=702744 RepID=A0ABP7GI61_9ACTN
MSSYCPRYQYAATFLGRRWAFTILRALFSGHRRFSEIRSAAAGVTDRVLTERLREMETEGLIERCVCDTSPVRVEYRLTTKGAALRATVEALQEWADTWVPLETAIQACGEEHAKS